MVNDRLQRSVALRAEIQSMSTGSGSIRMRVVAINRRSPTGATRRIVKRRWVLATSDRASSGAHLRSCPICYGPWVQNRDLWDALEPGASRALTVECPGTHMPAIRSGVSLYIQYDGFRCLRSARAADRAVLIELGRFLAVTDSFSDALCK